MAKKYLGEPIKRKEDVEMLRGEADYTADLSFPGIWLYAGDVPIVHVVFDWPIPTWETGAVDHLSFKASGDANEMAALLTSKGIEFSKRTLARTGITQIFLRDPDNVGVEFNYPAQNAAA